MAGLNIYLMVSEGRAIGKTNTPRDAITQAGPPPSGKRKRGSFISERFPRQRIKREQNEIYVGEDIEKVANFA